MLVPFVLKLSTSPSPANVSPVICSVALARLVLSMSVIDRPGEIAAVLPWVKASVVATPSVGGIWSIDTVVVTGALAALPSLTTQLIVRVGLEPKSFGLGPD